MRMKNLRAFLAIAISLMFAACAATPSVSEEHLAQRERVSSRYATAPSDRPGLGTKWAEKRLSLVGAVFFERANLNHLFAVAAIYYHDETGIRAMAAFRFGPVRESYAAEKYHNTRNVGVIGIALFNEVGSDPWTNEEVRRRLKANPFPGRFATPP